MVFTSTGKSTGSNNQTMISSNSQTQYSDDNTKSDKQVSEDHQLKRLTNLKLMYESESESCIEFITSGIDCGEDSETVEETILEIKEVQERYEFTIQELLDKAPSSDVETLCPHMSKLKFKIRKTTSAYRKYKKELMPHHKATKQITSRG